MSRRVIEDSDDDDDDVESITCALSPPSPKKIPESLATEINRLSSAATTQGSMQQHATNSTDPILFQAVYERTFGPNNIASKRTPSSQDFPSFTQLIASAAAPRMSSSPIHKNELSRDKSNHASSLTSISEPTKSNKKMKRAKSMKEVDELTQITTPHASKHASEKDIWDFPSSSASNGDTTTKSVKSRNAQRESAKKTYGKTLKRSKTMVDAASTHLGALDASVISQDDTASVNVNTHKRLPNSRDDAHIAQTLPQPKKHKSQMSVNAIIPNKMREDIHETQEQTPSTDLVNLVSTSTAPASIQILRSTSKELSSESHEISTGSVIIDSIDMHLHQKEQVTSTDELFSTDQGPQTLEPATISVILPSTLSDSQKRQYNSVDIDSTPSTYKSLELVSTDIVDTTAYPRAGKVPSPDDPALIGIIPALATKRHLASSSPNVSSDGRLKRARSELPSKAPSPSVSSPISGKEKSLKRRKTMTPIIGLSPSQASVDELSLGPVRSVETATPKDASNNGEKKRVKGSKDERISIDELFGSDEIGFPREMYESRPSRRQSKSMSVHDTDRDANESLKPKLKRANSMKGVLDTSHPVENHANLELTALSHDTIDLDGLGELPSISNDGNHNLSGIQPTPMSKIGQKKSILKSFQASDILINHGGESCGNTTISGSIILDDPTQAGARHMFIESESITVEERTPIKQKPGRKKLIPKGSKVSGSVTENVNSSRVQRAGEDSFILEEPTVSHSDKILDVMDCALDTALPSPSTTVHVSEPADSLEIAPTPKATPAPAPAKRRGRPPGRRKSAPVLGSPRVVDEVMETQPAEQIMPVKPIKLRRKGQQKTINVETLDATPLSKPAVDTSASRESGPENSKESPTRVRTSEFLVSKSTPPKERDAANEVQKTPSKAGKGPTKHSPLQSAKVPYRVGLSKRNKIAPLLKIIRK